MRGRLPGVWLLLVGLVLPGVTGCAVPPPEIQPAAADVLRRTVNHLASPELEGRGLGTAGLDHAGHYIAGYFQGLGLRPAPGQDSFAQPFKLTFVTAPAPTTSLAVADASYSLATDYIPSNYSAESSFEGPVVFVGYGIEGRGHGASPRPAGDEGYDDFAGVSLSGKIALAMAGEPVDANGRSRLGRAGSAERAALAGKARRAAARGAVALLLVQSPTSRVPDRLAPFRRQLDPASDLQSPMRGASAVAPIPVIQITRRTADDLFRRAGARPLETYARSIDDTLSPRSFALGDLRVRGRVAFARQAHRLRNIVGMIKGRGPRANQYIVVGAHYDHVGLGPGRLADGPEQAGVIDSLANRLQGIVGQRASAASRVRSYYPGADDNASGVAGLLELARLFSQSSRPARSIVFVAFAAEEVGLFGSQHFVDHPPVPLERVVAMINLDMLGRLRNGSLTIGGTGTAEALPRILAQANNPTDLQLRYTWNNGIAPSDNTPFARKRIPVLFFNTGSHSDLHRMTDTPDKINYPGQAQVVDLAARVIRLLTIEKELVFTDAPPATRPATTVPTRRGGS